MHQAITEEIFQVGGSGLTADADAAVYLVNFNGHAALVDAGCGGAVDRLFENISECGVDPHAVEYLLITHCHFDHTGGGRAVRDRTGCRTVAHELEAVYLETGDNTVTAAGWYGASIDPFPIDHKLRGESSDILLGEKTITAIHAPGHSPGSVVYLTESDGKKVLFAQDVHGPLAPDLKSDRRDYFASLHKLLALKADILCEGHFGVYKGEADIAAFIKSFL